MASNYPHEDADKLAYEKSEETYKEWDKYWKAVQLDKTESIMTVTQGTPIDWEAGTARGTGDVHNKSADSDKDRRWVFAMRHGERVDHTYGNWVPHCFDDNNTYTRKDLNLPLRLGERVGGKDSYAKDTPLTRVGQLQARLVGEGLRLAGIPIKHVYASCALRCVETAHYFLEGLQADNTVKVKVDPGLFEYKMWHLIKGMAPFMTPLELHKAGYNVDLSYKPYVEIDTVSPESLEDFYKRNEKTMHAAVDDTESEGGNIIFVGHAATLDLMAVALQRLREDNTDQKPYQISKHLLRVPYCALGAMKGKPWEIVAPPCPPSINSSSGRFDWKILLDL
uniref:Ecdysteroid-phosphate phosphatase n=1 Tax=Antheraea pernyi TaxID=7119 RepID=A0A0S1MM79_ANTPE|nr:ecdysteroid-phosphate phosphatase [Antheraea pernyi]